MKLDGIVNRFGIEFYMLGGIASGKKVVVENNRLTPVPAAIGNLDADAINKLTAMQLNAEGLIAETERTLAAMSDPDEMLQELAPLKVMQTALRASLTGLQTLAETTSDKNLQSLLQRNEASLERLMQQIAKVAAIDILRNQASFNKPVQGPAVESDLDDDRRRRTHVENHFGKNYTPKFSEPHSFRWTDSSGRAFVEITQTFHLEPKSPELQKVDQTLLPLHGFVKETFVLDPKTKALTSTLEGSKMVNDPKLLVEDEFVMLEGGDAPESVAKGAKEHAAVTAFNKYLVEQDHPWKQQKYKLCIEALKPAMTSIFNATTPLGRAAYDLQQLIYNPPKDGNYRVHLQTILKQYRAVLESPEFETELKKTTGRDPAVDVLLNLALTRFTNAHIFTFLDKLMNNMFLAGAEKAGFAGQAYTDFIAATGFSEKDFKALEKVPYEFRATLFGVGVGKLMGETGFGFDPHMQTNSPYTLGDMDIIQKDNVSKPVTLLRMGTPTAEGFWERAAIIPEFRAYLEALKMQGKKHLYISLQNEAVQKVGTETQRNDALKHLAMQYPGTFDVVVLAQDSAFYKQKDPLDKSAASFMREFEGQIMGEGTGFYFPSKWKSDPAFQAIIKNALTRVHHEVFNGKDPLTQQERKDFIEIAYAYLEPELMRYCGSDSCNISCKDAIDRAGKNNSLLMYLGMIVQGKTGSPEHQKMHRVLTHAAAFWVKKQPIVHGRRDRLVSAFQVLSDPAVQARIRASTQLVPINPSGDFHIQKIPNQWME